MPDNNRTVTIHDPAGIVLEGTYAGRVVQLHAGGQLMFAGGGGGGSAGGAGYSGADLLGAITGEANIRAALTSPDMGRQRDLDAVLGRHRDEDPSPEWVVAQARRILDNMQNPAAATLPAPLKPAPPPEFDLKALTRGLPRRRISRE